MKTHRPDARRFENLIVLVTGGTSGIGRETARQFARAGAAVTVCGRREDRARQALRSIRVGGGHADFVRCDVSREDDVRNLLATILERHGRLDIAVNSAGISPKRTPLVDVSVTACDDTLAVNVRGLLISLKHELRAMKRCRSGVIVNVASVLGLTALDLEHSAYTASKHAAVGLTRAAAVEYASCGIRVNAVCPGGVDTPIHATNTATSARRRAMESLHPMRRLASPREIAAAVLFLCSPEASFITGVSLPVDGGVVAR